MVSKDMIQKFNFHYFFLSHAIADNLGRCASLSYKDVNIKSKRTADSTRLKDDSLGDER